MPTREEIIWSEYSPRIQAARELETDRRHAAFVAHDRVIRVVAGVVLQPLTLRRFGTLVLARNVYVTREAIPPANNDPDYAKWWAVQNAQFLWLVGPHDVYCATELDAFMNRVVLCSLEETFRGIRDYLEHELGCTVPKRGATESDDNRGGPSFIAWYIHRFAKLYGWSMSEILDMTMSQVSQLDQIAEIENDYKEGRTPVILNGESDRIIAQALEAMNRHE